MDRMTIYCSLLTILTLFGQSSSQSCHLRELDLCAATLLVFAQNPSETPTTDAAIDRQCNFIREADECTRNYTNKCATPLQRELIEFVAVGGRSVAQEFCTAGSALREEYKKHSKCLGEARLEGKRCSRDLQVAIEKITTSEWDDRIPMGCCAFNRFQECTSSIVQRRCGSEAVKLGKRVMGMATSKLPEAICRNFSVKSKKCIDVLPPTGLTPEGNRSSSLLARMFATFAGN